MSVLKVSIFRGHVTLKFRRGAYITLHFHTKLACMVLAPYDKVYAGAGTLPFSVVSLVVLQNGNVEQLNSILTNA